MTAGELPHRGALPRRGRGLTPQRRGLGLLLAALTLPALTGALLTVRGDLALGSVLLLYLLAVVVISVIGGLAGGVLAAIGSFLLANFFLIPPYHTLAVEDRDSIIALLVFLLVAVTVSVLVDVAARRQAAATRSEADAILLGRVAAEPLVGTLGRGCARRGRHHLRADLRRPRRGRHQGRLERAGRGPCPGRAAVRRAGHAQRRRRR